MTVSTCEALVYSPEEVSKLLGLSLSSVYDRLAERKIPAFRLGRKYFIPKERFNKWLEAMQNPTYKGEGI